MCGKSIGGIVLVVVLVLVLDAAFIFEDEEDDENEDERAVWNFHARSKLHALSLQSCGQGLYVSPSFVAGRPAMIECAQFPYTVLASAMVGPVETGLTPPFSTVSARSTS